MFTSCFLCVFITYLAVSQGFYHSNNDLKSENGSVLTKITNDIGSLTIYNTKIFDKEKKIFAYKNEVTKECILKLVDDQENILNFNDKYDQNMELTEDEMVEIIGENLIKFCKDKTIILNNFGIKRISRSKRAIDKKRYQGQTQTQFVSFGSKNSNQETKNGLAEALSQPDLSRATVSGLNGMGQAQSQSSFGECDECYEKDYQTHSTHDVNSQSGYFPSLRPSSSISQNQNSRPYSESNSNKQSPSLQNEKNQRGHSINDQYSDTYSGSGINNKLPDSKFHDIGQSLNSQYPGSITNYKVPDKQNQGYVINDQYPRSEINNQDYGYGTTPSVNNRYTDSGTNIQLPENQDHRYGIESSLRGQYPGKIQDSKSNINTELSKIDSGHVYNSVNEQIPNLANTNTPEYKETVNNNLVHSNPHSINSIPLNPNSWDYPNKIYPDGSRFPNIPSELGQGILTPHNTPNYDSTHPSYNWQVPVTTSREHQIKPSNYPSSLIPNYQHSMPDILDQLALSKPISSDTNSQIKQRILNEAGGNIQNGYPLSSNIPGDQDYTQLNLPSLCNFLYQTCLNALLNNKRLNEFQIASSQNNIRNQNTGKQIGSTQVPIMQHPGLPLYGEGINQNQKRPNSGQLHYTTGSDGSGIQHPSYTQTSENINRLQSSYDLPQGTLGSRGSGFQQPGYAPSGGNVNQMQSNYGQPQDTLGSGVSDFQQTGYAPMGGNVNQMQPNYDMHQGTLGSGGFGFQRPGYSPSGGNVNQMQPNYGKPQGTLGSEGSGFQQPGYSPSGGNVNQMQPNYGKPQGTLGSEGSGFQQSGYAPSGGNVNQMQTESYDDNSSRGSSFKPGTEMENINPSISPIIGGQFGTDISSGGSVTLVDTEGGDAQSMTNVDVDGQETRASASAQGKSKTGMSQTQVSGSYLGTGTFSAQAQTSDSDKGAQSQIVSNTNGTTSKAQGKGGKGQAQSQVLYNADNGIALGEAQSSGMNYGTNTQLQAGIKGGMADAQSTGLGSTSSQAQIGFLPHESSNNTNQKSLFKGGGTTSAQGGPYSGQSQSQLFGSYKHGISYNGAAQASSGKKLQNLPKLNLADTKLKIGKHEETNNEIKNQTNALKSLQSIPNPLQPQNQTENYVDDHKQQNISSTQTPPILPQELSRNADIYPDYEDNDEYDDDSDEIINTKSVQTKKETIPKQEQNIVLNLDDKHDAQITRDSDSQLKSGLVLDAGQVIPGTNGTKIPSGFRGRVASVAGDHTKAQAIPGSQAQTQTVFLTPGVGSLTVVDKTKLRAQLNKESYISPTNSFQTEINGGISKFKPNENNVQYFTKSSTCGYFSFSCNYVNGATNGAKICKPNPPPFPCLRSN